VHLFERKKAAAAALLADAAAAQAVLSGLQLSPQELAALWGNCSKRDKDGSGYLTGAAAVQFAAARLSASLLGAVGLNAFAA
jgi:hypothetical protein